MPTKEKFNEKVRIQFEEHREEIEEVLEMLHSAPKNVLITVIANLTAHLVERDNRLVSSYLDNQQDTLSEEQEFFVAINIIGNQVAICEDEFKNHEDWFSGNWIYDLAKYSAFGNLISTYRHPDFEDDYRTLVNIS